MSNFKSVKKFMETFGQEVKEKAEFPSEKITTLRYDLIYEELTELRDAIDKKDIKLSEDNEFVDVLVAIEEEMNAIRELYVGGYISKGVYISETDRLYEKAKIFGL